MGENVEQGRNADILQSIIDNTEYTDPPQSRIEDLLLQLKELIEEGGGGGGDVTSVNGKTGAVTLTASDVGAYTTAETDALLGDKQNKTLSASVKIGTETKTTVEGAIGEVAAIIPATAATSNKLSTAADTAKEDITATASGSDITFTDAADARVQGVTVKGHSEVVDGEIKSIGDAGWGVVDLGTLTWEKDQRDDFAIFVAAIADIKLPDTSAERLTGLICSGYELSTKLAYTEMEDKSIMRNLATIVIKDSDYYNSDATAFKSAMNGVLLYYPLADASQADPLLGIMSRDGAGQGTAVTLTTGLPLRSTLDGTVYDELTNEKVVTRCEVVNDEVVPLATPVTTPLSDAEKSAFAEFRTFDGSTSITATDNPFMMLKYVKDTENGKALANVDNKSAVRMAMIAAPYDDTATYAVGNYCTCGNKLWKCSTAIGTAEPFTASHWTATTVMEEI